MAASRKKRTAKPGNGSSASTETPLALPKQAPQIMRDFELPGSTIVYFGTNVDVFHMPSEDRKIVIETLESLEPIFDEDEVAEVGEDDEEQ